MRIAHIIPSFWVVILAGCAVESASLRLPHLVDSAGVRIVTNHAPQWLDQDTWRVAGEPRLVIGGQGVAETHELHQVAGALRQGNRIIIANAGTQEIRFYGVDGRLQSRMVRKGMDQESFVGSRASNE